MRGSVFDDPGDEKSWHVSQRSENLQQYYEGREPYWYATAVAPFAEAERVLDLGCGPGLALRALRDLGCSTVLGVDRWPAFVAGAAAETPIVAHDLSLPMPFLESASFDGVLSHYALDYVSPICVRQVLREAHRVLAPGGLLVIYLAGIGLAGGDESRTIAYSPAVMRALLEEAGFEGLEVEASSNGRNTVARARRSIGVEPAEGAPRQAVAIDGDTQLSASFPAGGERIGLELSGEGRKLLVSADLPAGREETGEPLSLCARVPNSRIGGTELQLCAWRGHAPLIAERLLVEFPVTELRVAEPAVEAGHVSVWRPGELALEPPGNARVDLTARDQLLVPARLAPDLGAADREWLAGEIHGVVATSAELRGEDLRALLLWCGWRQCPLYLTATDWAETLATVRRRRDELTGPVVLVDPAVSDDRPAQPLPDELVEFALDGDRFLVLLGAGGVELAAPADLARLARRLLLGVGATADAAVRRDAGETLRYLTERTLLMRLRQAKGRSWAEVGRRPL